MRLGHILLAALLHNVGRFWCCLYYRGLRVITGSSALPIHRLSQDKDCFLDKSVARSHFVKNTLAWSIALGHEAYAGPNSGYWQVRDYFLPGRDLLCLPVLPPMQKRYSVPTQLQQAKGANKPDFFFLLCRTFLSYPGSLKNFQCFTFQSEFHWKWKYT